MEKIKQNPFVKKVGFNRIVLCCVLLLMYGLFCALTGGSFAGMNRIMSALNYAYFLGFLSLGVTFVIATGQIDFSIGPVLLCTYLRLHIDNTWDFNAGCNPDQYPCRICFWAL